MQYTIIGGSIAGLTCAKTIKYIAPDADITLISPEMPYYRPLIPLLINGQKTASDIDLQNDFLKEINFINDKMSGLDIPSKEISISPGTRIKFDRLLIATGSIPIIPDIPGISGEGTFTLRTKNDAINIKYYAEKIKNAVIIGGGFIGVKAASILSSLASVTVIEKLDQILYQKVDKKGAEIISDALKNKGIKIINNEHIAEIIRDKNKIKQIRLGSGKLIDAEMIIIGVGVKSNIEIFKNTGIEINKGILINERMETNIPDIYAAGDVVEYKNILTGGLTTSALWTNAGEMGRIAGKNMTGANSEYPGFLTVMNSIELFDIPVVSIGIIQPEKPDEHDIRTEISSSSYKKFIFRNNKMIGISLIGDIKNSGIYLNIIKNNIIISESIKNKIINGTLHYADFMNV